MGGGDGGILRQLLRHYSAEILSITVVEIDPAVMAVACEHFAGTAAAFADPRVRVVAEDAAQYLRQHNNNDPQYSVILVDSSDPVGPAASLFSPAFYESMYQALEPTHGLACAQAECIWIHMDLIADVMACCRDMFATAAYASALVPTYPCGQLGFCVARKGSAASLRTPVRSVPERAELLQYYSPAVHRAAFVVPRFVQQRLGEEDEEDTADRTDCFLSRCIIQ